MTAINQKKQIEKYFSILKDVLDKEGLMDKPAQIYNVNETGMPLDHRPPHVVVQKGQKKVRYRSSGNKSQVTVVGRINAAGSAIHYLSYMMPRVLICSGQKVKYLGPHIVGLTWISLKGGLRLIFFVML
uniref:DDE-1 domain-containing protein n=1 Tax=Amphimedon queenslandica TaxID=400682 RepID=A0A1X7U6Q8_AMPQE